MLIEREELLTLVPHAGNMCLLERVLRWDADSIACTTTTHRADTHPLRRGERLNVVHACEYGAQAMAVHGGLLGRAHDAPPLRGFLAALRDVQWHVWRLDTIAAPLQVEARRLLADGGNMIYEFRISAEEQALVSGSATVVAQPEPETRA